MTRTLLLTAIFFTAAPQISAKGPPRPVGCSAFFVGNWAGAGTVTEFGPPMQVASTASYKSNGTFAASTRYLGRDKKWIEQRIAGKWNARTGNGAKSCTLILKSVSTIGESSSTSDFTIIDANTYRSFGVDLKRLRSDSGGSGATDQTQRTTLPTCAGFVELLRMLPWLG